MNPLRKREVATKLKVSPQWIDKELRAGRFVRPFFLSPQIPVWDETDIDAYLQQMKTPGDEDGIGKRENESLQPA